MPQLACTKNTGNPMTKIAEANKSHIFRRLIVKTRQAKAKVSVASVRIQTELFDTAQPPEAFFND
jgi:hypothetical protein